ncbi:MAG: hypothetical protein AAFU71_11075 [Cyanobacteria bacterium J06632_22]
MTSALPTSTDAELLELTTGIRSLAEARRGNCLALLDLLRKLEEQHQHIRETLFREALPDNRQVLYRLLRDIEINGGWPYIKRMTLAELMEKLYAMEGRSEDSRSGEG